MYDIIIIGSGCAGYAAAMYSGRLSLNTLVLGEVDGGTIILTDTVENYPGFKKIAGIDLANNLKEHALDYKKFVEIRQEKAVSIKKDGCFAVYTDKNKKHTGKTIIFATGTKHRKLNIPGEDNFSGRGVYSCALCDGILYKNKVVSVVGGSDSAAKEAILLAQWAKKVYMIYRGSNIHPEPVNMQRINALVKKNKIEIINNTNVSEIKGNSFLTHVLLDRPYKKSHRFKTDAVFVDIGQIPQTSLAKDLGIKLNNRSEIITDKDSRTNIQGFFAAGDVTDIKFKQAIIGVAQAVTAAYSAYEFITQNRVNPCND